LAHAKSDLLQLSQLQDNDRPVAPKKDVYVSLPGHIHIWNHWPGRQAASVAVGLRVECTGNCQDTAIPTYPRCNCPAHETRVIF